MSRNNSAKIPLGLMRGKPITTSVPTIRYHASDDELEELYPSTDEEKQPESEKSSPYKSLKTKDDGERFENTLEKRSASMDLSDGAHSSDPWKKFSQIKGKISKTIEEKLSEMKSDKKKHKRTRSRDASVSDPEDFILSSTPTDDVFEKHVKEKHSRFVGFSDIKVGFKTEDDSVESGVEAAESTLEDISISANDIVKTEEHTVCEESTFSQTRTKEARDLIYQAALLIVALWVVSSMPFPQFFVGLLSGLIATIAIHKMLLRVRTILTTSPKQKVPVLEIPAAEEQVVLDRYEGWVNEYPFDYTPEDYHVARTRSVFFRLEGEVLQVMETRTRIPKRAIWDEPKHKAKFTRKRIYNLSETKVDLLPHGLIRRRRWSKKYPICITFYKDGLTDSITLTNSSDDEEQPTDVEKSSNVIVEEEETDDDLSQSKDLREEFSDCQDESEEVKFKMYIFARTDRQKEDWFRRLVQASKFESAPISKESTTTSVEKSSISDKEDKSPQSNLSSEMPPEVSYSSYMARYVETNVNSTPESDQTTTNENLWVNALLGRILFDLHKCPDTITAIQDKIQRKLSNIKLPYFMESLSVSEVAIGQGAPIIHSSTKPILDDRGLWFDLEISYEGCLTMTIETKLNLMKLKKSTNGEDDSDVTKYKTARSPMFDSDVEDSPETSTEDEDSIHLSSKDSAKESNNQSSGRKLLNIVDKLAANKYFQSATELSYIKRAMEGVSNTEIRLMVSVSSIEGVVTMNIPPAPSDRLWYGFRPVPRINLTAKPALGERAVNIVYVTKWIETKLLREFEKVVVIPNMDDLMIPLCTNYPYD